MKYEKKKQLLILNKFKEIHKYYNKALFDPYKDDPLYFAPYSNSLGLILIKSYANIKSSFFLNFKTILADFFYSSNYLNFKIFENLNKIKYDKIIITWSFKSDFNPDGSLNDRYLNVNSKKIKKTLWFCIYMDKKLPKKIEKNIVIFQQINKKKVNILKIFKNFFLNLRFLFTDFRYFLFKISNFNFFSYIFLKNFRDYINQDLKQIIMPYEGQPFQNHLINFIKKEKLKIKISGYVHSPPLAFPATFIYKNNSPDEIFLNGKDQVYCFSKLLGWKRNKLKLIPSPRFLKSFKDMSSKIYFPFNIKSEKIILASLNHLIKVEKFNFNGFEIKIHPASCNSKKINEIVKKVKNTIKNSSIKNRRKEKVSLFIGTSGAIVEALERGIKVIQIAENPILDIYSDLVWKSVNIKKMYNNIFFYSLKKRGNLIKFGNRTVNLKKETKIPSFIANTLI